MEENFYWRGRVGVSRGGVGRHHGNGIEDQGVVVFASETCAIDDRTVEGAGKASSEVIRAFVNATDTGFAAASHLDAAIGRRGRLVDKTILIERDRGGSGAGGATFGRDQLSAIIGRQQVVDGRLLRLAMGGEVKTVDEQGLQHAALLFFGGTGAYRSGDVEEHAGVGEVGELVEAEVVGFAD